MAYNVPQYDVTKFSFGPGVLYIGPAGVTPTIDIGAVRSGATFEVTRTLVDINQGSPATLVETFVTAESATLTVTGLEWNFKNFARALGVEVPTDENVFEFGGSMRVIPVSLKFVHETPYGVTLVLSIWKARGGDRFRVGFTDDPHEFEFVFHALEAITNWAGESLPLGKRLFKFEKIT